MDRSFQKWVAATVSVDRTALLTITAVAFGILAVAQPRAQEPAALTRFPTGYDYPLRADALERMVAAREEAQLRRHGWFLWAGLSQPGPEGWPFWASWPKATQVFAKAGTEQDGPVPKLARQQTTNTNTNEPTGKELASLEARSKTSLLQLNVQHKAAAKATLDLTPPFYEIPQTIREKYKKELHGITTSAKFPDGAFFQSNGDVMLVTEPYSQEAYDFIRGNQLYDRNVLDRLQHDRKKDIPPLPARSIVLKHMYWPVKKDGLSALPVVTMSDYDKSGPAQKYIGFENMSRWPNAVAIDPSGTRVGQTAAVTYLYDVRQFAPGPSGLVPPPLGPHTYTAAKVVGLSDFYYKKLSMDEFIKMDVYDRLLIDVSFYWAYKRLFQDGDYLVSIASHIMTKEMPSWTLQSVWWHPDPDSGAYAKDRPDIPDAKGPWRHYLMTVEDGITTVPNGDKLPVAYNPYIELAADHPVKTNCRNCHTRADLPKPAYITPDGVPGALADIKPSDKIFTDKLRTDFLWTITDRALPLPKN